MWRVRWVGLLLGLAGLSFGVTDTPRADGQEKGKTKEQKKAENQAKKAALAKDDGQNDLSRVSLAFDPGSHTRPISAMSFTADQSKLVTVSWDYSIQIWNARTGERLDILRLPAYGRDNANDADLWNVAAVSADGNYVAIGGAPKFLWDETTILTRLLLVDVPNKRVRKYIIPLGNRVPIVGLAFSADGNRLAVTSGGEATGIYIVDDIHRFLRDPDARRGVGPKLVTAELKGLPQIVALTPKGDRLAVGELRGYVRAWDVTGTDATGWKKIADFTVNGRTDELAWSPDGTQFVRAWTAGVGPANRGIDLYTAGGERLKRWPTRDLAPGFVGQNVIASFRWIAADRLFVSAHGTVDAQSGSGAVGLVLDPTTGKTERRFATGTDGMFLPIGSATADGTLAATTVDLGLEAVVYRLADGEIVARCGSRSPTPTRVGWSRDPAAPAIAWADQSDRRLTTEPDKRLQYAFDLTRLEPRDLVPNRFQLHQYTAGDWSLDGTTRPNNFVNVSLKNAATGESRKLSPGHTATLIPRGTEPPLYAQARHDGDTQMGSFATIYAIDGSPVTNLLPTATRHRDMVPSPDGRYLLVSTGTHRLSIYKTDGSRFPFMNFVQVNGEWILWTPEGYYAASPGGDKLIGWAVTNGANEFVRYYPAERYAKHFRRPDVLRLAIEKGSVKLALESLNASALAIEKALPAVATLAMVEQRGAKVVLKVMAKAGSKDKPITAMQLLLDGRPVAAKWAKPFPADAIDDSQEVELPAGLHELKLLVRTADVATLSEPLSLSGPRTGAKLPMLHRLSVGISQYDNTSLKKIETASKDAKAIFAALGTDCVGDRNRFGATVGELLLDKDASRERILQAIKDTRKRVKPGDLFVLFFAVHGQKHEKEYYLLTHDAPKTGSLDGHSLSGNDLRTALKDFDCPVLLLLDARHDSTGGQPARSATDDLTRDLCDETIGVTVLSAAMAHEPAGATAENGYFALGLLKGLKAGRDVPFDPYERTLYANHLHMVAFSEVRRVSKGMQNPFLHSPWTAPPLALRLVPEK